MMVRFFALFILALFFHENKGLTYYEYYAPAGENITSGLIAEGDDFTLNGKVIKIYSGTFHYFRVHPDHWRDTLKKLRAAGLNTVETYTPWNLHNPQPSVFDFGTGTDALSPFLDVRTFVQMAKEEDLFVFFRPGPYICAEWDFGGMPSWLLRDYAMKVRSFYGPYLNYVDQYFVALGEQLGDLSFQKGGAIIAVQVENEFGHFGYEDQPRDKRYLEFVHNSLVNNGFEDALFTTSDTTKDTLDWGSIPGALMTANFQTGADENFAALKKLQPNRPLMVTEFWTGWYDYWFGIHETRSPDDINSYLNNILTKNSSVNFYMFIGGTNFGFMAGANRNDNSFPFHRSVVTSYDYDAPLTEAGDYGPKYQLFKDTIKSFNPLNGIVEDPEPPVERTKTAYGNFSIIESMNLQTLSSQVTDPTVYTGIPPAMEDFDIINGNNGQSYGYATYSTTVDLPAGNSTLLIRGHVRDLIQVLVNGEVITKPYSDRNDVSGFGFWHGRDKTIDFSTLGGTTEITFLAESLGRVNFGTEHYYNLKKKGIWEGPLYVNKQELTDWSVVPLEFRMDFMNSLTGWEPYTAPYTAPGCYRVIMTIESEATITDTFLDMREWNKGVVFVNGFNLGRYWEVGPTRSLYVPAPLLKVGDNEFVIFEQYTPGPDLKFIDHLLLG